MLIRIIRNIIRRVETRERLFYLSSIVERTISRLVRIFFHIANILCNFAVSNFLLIRENP